MLMKKLRLLKNRRVMLGWTNSIMFKSSDGSCHKFRQNCPCKFRLELALISLLRLTNWLLWLIRTNIKLRRWPGHMLGRSEVWRKSSAGWLVQISHIKLYLAFAKARITRICGSKLPSFGRDGFWRTGKGNYSANDSSGSIKFCLKINRVICWESRTWWYFLRQLSRNWYADCTWVRREVARNGAASRHRWSGQCARPEIRGCLRRLWMIRAMRKITYLSSLRSRDLLSIHNERFIVKLVDDIRASLEDGTFYEFRDSFPQYYSKK